MKYSMKPGPLSSLGKHILERTEFSDLKLLVHGQSIDVHKVVLATRSKYFDSMLSGRFREYEQDSIDLSDTVGNLEDLRTVINYMYTGSIKITTSNLEDILAAANHMLLMDVKNFCSDFMFKHMTLDNCIRYLALADMYSMAELHAVCLELVTCRFKHHLQYSDSILDVPGAFWLKLIQAGALVFLTPLEIKALLLRWYEHNPEERSEECLDILKSEHILKSETLQADTEEQPTNTKKDLEAQPEITVESLRNEVAKASEATFTFNNNVEKALIHWTMETISSRFTPMPPPTEGKKSDVRLKMSIFFPEVGRWYHHKQDFKLPSGVERPRELVGFIDNAIVFTIRRERVVLCTFKESGVHWSVSAPPTHAVSSCFHAHGGVVFYISLEVSQSTAEMTVHSLDPDSMEWKEECKGVVLPVNPEDPDESKAQMQTCPTKETLYVLVSNLKVFKFVKILPKPSGGFTLDVRSQPYFRESKPNPFTRMFDYAPTQQCREYMIVTTQPCNVLYNTSTDQWDKGSQADNIYRIREFKPEYKVIPVYDATDVTRVDIDVDMTSAHFPADHGDRACLYMAGKSKLDRLWMGIGKTGEPENVKWTELTPPPACSFNQDMRVFVTPVSVLKHFDLYTQVPQEDVKKELFKASHLKLEKKASDDEDEDGDDDDEEEEEEEDEDEYPYDVDYDGYDDLDHDWYNDSYDEEENSDFDDYIF